MPADQSRLTGREVTERLRNAFAPHRVKVQLVDHGEDVAIEFIAEDGSTKLSLEPVPLHRLSTVAAIDLLVVQIKQHLDEA